MKHRLIASIAFFVVGRLNVMGKMAVITVELVDESIAASNNAIAGEILKWFKDEPLLAPWVKEVKTVVVRAFRG
jgi:hypothetical protein